MTDRKISLHEWFPSMTPTVEQMVAEEEKMSDERCLMCGMIRHEEKDYDFVTVNSHLLLNKEASKKPICFCSSECMLKWLRAGDFSAADLVPAAQIDSTNLEGIDSCLHVRADRNKLVLSILGGYIAFDNPYSTLHGGLFPVDCDCLALTLRLSPFDCKGYFKR